MLLVKRYGRKKKRAHIQEIKDLKAQVKNLQEANLFEHKRASIAEGKARDAKDLALKFYLEKSGMMQEVMARISEGLAVQLGKELHPYAMKLFTAGQRELESPIDFFTDNAFSHTMRQCEVIHAEIPKMRLSIRLG